MTKEEREFLVLMVKKSMVTACNQCPLLSDFCKNYNPDASCGGVWDAWLLQQYPEPVKVIKKSTVNMLIDQLMHEPREKEIAYSLWYVSDILYEAEQMGVELSPDEVSTILIDLNNIDADTGINWQSIQDTIHAVQNKKNAAKFTARFVDVIKRCGKEQGKNNV